MSGWLFVYTGDGRYHLSAREPESIIVAPLCGTPLPADCVESVSSTRPAGATRRCRRCAVAAGLVSPADLERRRAPELHRCETCARDIPLGVRWCASCLRRQRRGLGRAS